MSKEPRIPIDIDSFSEDDLRVIAVRELERRARVSAARKGVPKSPMTRKRISQGMYRAWARKKAAQKLAAEAGELTEPNRTTSRVESTIRDVKAPQRGHM